jgi:hypothetical protein
MWYDGTITTTTKGPIMDDTQMAAHIEAVDADLDAALTRFGLEEAEASEQRAFETWLEAQCEGHESLRGDLMGAEFFCNGRCTGLTTEDYAAELEERAGA